VLHGFQHHAATRETFLVLSLIAASECTTRTGSKWLCQPYAFLIRRLVCPRRSARFRTANGPSTLLNPEVVAKLLVEVDGDMLETVRVMLGVRTNQDAVQGALALLIAGQNERVPLGIEALATHNDAFSPHDRSEAWR
jgi:hypothetical protein